jgi:nicotinamidase/pyrazinamidase
MRALILVDLQPDFCPGGALAVAEGDATIAIANALMPRFDVVVATQDWHPAHHQSFATQHPGHHPGDVVDLHGLPQVLWPPHCVQDTPGAAIHPQLDHARITHVSQKGTDPAIDSYSAFFDNGHRKATGLAAWLKERSISDLTVLGLATDYCVKFTVLDARELGFSVRLVADGCRGVNLSHGDSDRAIEAMRAAGAQIIDSSRA